MALRGRVLPVAIYFALTFAISWAAAALVVAGKILHGQPIGKFDGLMMFPAMLLGPLVTGPLLTFAFDGVKGLRTLGARLIRVRMAPAWYVLPLMPPALVIGVLMALAALVSPGFTPNAFFAGIMFGLIPGFVEEVGWSGFATPRLAGPNRIWPGVFLGLIWGVWHLPVLDFLGAASPHGAAFPAYACAFIAAMTAMRVIMVWALVRTNSVFLVQLVHAGSTGAFVVLSPAVAPQAEAVWIFVYAGLLWMGAAWLLVRNARPRTEAQQA